MAKGKCRYLREDGWCKVFRCPCRDKEDTSECFEEAPDARP